MRKKLYCIGLFFVLLLLPFLLQQIDDYLLHIAVTVGVYIILALSLNVIVGYAGLFAIGHAAFYGIGAYAAALLIVNFGVSFWLALPLAAVITCLFGCLLGSTVIRLKGDYLGIVTLAFGEIVRLLFVNLVDVTRGPMGIPGIAPPSFLGRNFDNKIDFYFLILLLDLLTIFLVNRIVYSGVGMDFLVCREDETLAKSIGIRPVKYKLLAFAVGTFLAGAAGAFWASYITYISPDAFQYMDSINILSMVVLGGTASLGGSVIGAVILVLAPEILRFTSNYRMVIMGLLIIIMMIFKPSGFWGEKHRRFNFYGRKVEWFEWKRS